MAPSLAIAQLSRTSMAVFWGLTVWEWIFYIFCFHRYFRLIINTAAHWLYRSKPLPKVPTLTNQDVTVIVPTIENSVEELRGPVRSLLACDPFEVILVTTVDRYAKLLDFALSLKDSRVKVYESRIANKRLQLREAIPRVTSKITILVDDDVTWPITILPWLLAPLEIPSMGAVGVCQQVKRLVTGSLVERCYNWLGADYLERRNFEISATHYMDGGTSCMSGRTCAFRTEILNNSLFLEGFCNERWGRYHLNADDDNFVTRWLVSHEWKTWIQYNEECMLTTTLENNPKFLRQCLRWARSNWRSNYTSLFKECHVWYQQPWSVYAIYTATFTSLGLVADPFLFIAYSFASETWDPQSRRSGWIVLVIWYLFTKVVKRIGLLRRNPWDVVFIPVSIFFGFAHGFIKIIALFTWNVTSWGSRPDGDINDSERMTPLVLPAEVMTNPASHSQGLIRYRDWREEKCMSSEKNEKGSLAEKPCSENTLLF